MPAVAPRSIEPRDDNFTGDHTVVIVLAVLASVAGILLLIFSLRKARKEDRQAKERGAFLHGLQTRDNELSMAELLAAPIPVLRGMRT